MDKTKTACDKSEVNKVNQKPKARLTRSFLQKSVKGINFVCHDKEEGSDSPFFESVMVYLQTNKSITILEKKWHTFFYL